MKQKQIVTELLCIFLGTLLLLNTISSGVAINKNSRENIIIYVDDDNIQGPWDGTLEHPYQNIQDGIDNASPDDTVYVFKGLYDRIIVNKTIQLVGENINETIIATSDCAVLIEADRISIKKFTIKADILCMSIGSHHHNHITSNILTSIYSSVNKGRLPECGIALGSSTHNVISDNIIMNRGQGIVFQDSSDNTVSGNFITNCAVGILFEWWCNNNTIIRNKISDIGIYGIWITESSDNNIIYHNNFINNNPNAYDECTNMWDDDYPSGGNYWDDYTGVDENEDGIGDTPYNILGGGNQDRYPLMDPYVSPEFEITEIAGGIGIHANIKNIGEGDANDVKWNITIEGGLIIFPRKTSDEIPTLATGDSVKIHMFVVGIGIGKLSDIPVITIKVEALDANTAEEIVIARLLGPFVILH